MRPIRAARAAARTAGVLSLLTALLTALLAGPTPSRAHAGTGPCPALHQPLSRVRVFFSEPTASKPSPITSALVRATCAAARGSYINFSLYYVDYLGDDSEVNRIFDALAWVHRNRGVRVRGIIEKQLYATKDPAYTSAIDRLRQFARIDLCRSGCLSERSAPVADIQHSKVFLVSNTRWKSGTDRVVLQSSANWSWTQLRGREQSAVMIWDDPTLYHEYAVRWSTMHVCASDPRGCAAWNDQLAARGLDPQLYGLVESDGVWSDAVPHTRLGSPGRGTGVDLSPWQDDSDPVAVQLRRTGCRTGGTLRINHMFVASGRQKVIGALVDLQAQGCDVRVLVSSRSYPAYVAGISAMRAAGLHVSCAADVHDKYIVFDSFVGSPTSARTVWTGSQSLSWGALRYNDETFLKISAGQAAGDAVAENAAAYDAYAAHWQALYQQRVRCPTG